VRGCESLVLVVVVGSASELICISEQLVDEDLVRRLVVHRRRLLLMVMRGLVRWRSGRRATSLLRSCR
jgi:hypothetical protein